jgi:chromosome condensin MukBEF complex kleisin-like MukF subunit
MARTDLQEHEISQLERKAKRVLAEPSDPWQVSKIDADRLLRLTGEVLELRNREATTRQLHNLEWDEY